MTGNRNIERSILCEVKRDPIVGLNHSLNPAQMLCMTYRGDGKNHSGENGRDGVVFHRYDAKEWGSVSIQVPNGAK